MKPRTASIEVTVHFQVKVKPHRYEPKLEEVIAAISEQVTAVLRDNIKAGRVEKDERGFDWEIIPIPFLGLN